MTAEAEALGKKIADCLYDLIDAERPDSDTLVQAMALAVGYCIVCNIATYDQPEAKDALIADIERSVSAFQSVSTPEIERTRRPLI